MKINIYKDYEAMSMSAADEIIECIKNKPTAVICLASGDTPKLMCKLLVDKITSTGLDISQCTFIGLDEWVGIPPVNEGSCSYFFHAYLFKPLKLLPEQFHLFNALSQDLQAECTIMNKVITNKNGIDIMIVGVGMNGHIGFNETGVSLNNHAHVIELEEITQSVGQKYFNTSVKIDKGITLGLQNLLEAKKVIMIANSSKKAPVIKHTVQDEISTAFPATIMRLHSNGILMIDEDAAGLIA